MGEVRLGGAVVGVALLLCAVWILSTSSSFNTCKANQTAAKSEQAKENAPPITLSLADDIALKARCTGHVIFEYRDAATAVATVFIALFTFTLWWSTKGMMKATKDAVDLARQEFISTHRPRITVYGLAFGGGIASDKPVPISFRYVNSGDSDAKVTGIGSHIFRLTGTVLPGEIPFKHEEIAPPIDFPSGMDGIKLTLDTIRPATVLAAGAKPDSERIVCAGYVLYRDGNGTRRRTGFCRQFDLATGRWSKMQDDEYEYSY